MSYIQNGFPHIPVPPSTKLLHQLFTSQIIRFAKYELNQQLPHKVLQALDMRRVHMLCLEC